MPELPDVEVFKQYLDATGLHQRVEKVTVRDRAVLDGVSANRLIETVEGGSLSGTRRHGKYLFVELSESGWLVLHFGMTGFLKYYRKEDKQPEHPRLILAFDNGYRLVYDCRRKLGRVFLAENPASFIDSKNLGPDALSPELDRKAFAEIFSGSRATVKAALMDQSRIAGIGNVYADEILFQARVHPASKAGKLDAGRIDTLYEKRKEVLLTAIDRRADPDDLPEGYLLPRRQRDGQCPVCGGDLEKSRISGRPTYSCPRCQKNSG